MNDYNISVLGKIFTAVESGGQVYGQGAWDDVTLPHFGVEKTLTLGAYQFGGGSNEGRDLLRMIREKYPEKFKLYDNCGLAKTLDIDWLATGFVGTDEQRKVIGKLISTEQGIECQTLMYGSVQLPKYLKHAYDFGVPEDNIPALMMWAEIDHLGGSKAPQRVFKRCGRDLSVDNILSALNPYYADHDKYDTPVEDAVFWSRHVACVKFIKQYAQYPEEKEGEIMAYDVQKVLAVAHGEVGYMEKRSNKDLDSKTANAGSNNYTKYGRDMLKTVPEYGDCYGIDYQWCDQFVDWCFVKAYGKTAAKKLLIDWSAYTPTSAGYYKKAGRYGKNPRIGAQIFFHNSERICHTGLVDGYDDTYVYTTEGNTSNGTAVISNGGMVCRKKYLRSNSRIDGYGYPDYGMDTENGSEGTSDASTDISMSVLAGQKFLNGYYGDVVKASIGHLLDEDNDFGSDTYNACLAVWKDIANRLYGANLTITNHNFGESCREVAKKMAVCYGVEGTLVWIYETMLSAYGYYHDSMDGAFGSNMEKAVMAFQKDNGLEVDGILGANSVYALFNFKR